MEIMGLVIVGCMSLLVVLVVGLVGLLGVLGVVQRVLELAMEIGEDESQTEPEQGQSGKTEG